MRGHWRNSERSRRTLISRSLRRANPGVEFPSQPRSNFLVRTCVGTWLSLVEHSLGVRGVGSSNLPVPTNHFSYLRFPCPSLFSTHSHSLSHSPPPRTGIESAPESVSFVSS